MDLKEGDRFKATDRTGRTSTGKLVKRKGNIHYLLEATDETYDRCEKNYISILKKKRKLDYKTIEKVKQKKDFCTIEVGPAWFNYREIEILEQNI